MKNKNDNQKISRRKFMGGTAMAAATFTLVPGYVLGLGGATSPNEKLNIAGIGVGGQGGHDLGQMTSENIVALCDVDWARAAGTFRKFPDAKKYKDFRKMLEGQKNIDAVVVATPDHVHAAASIASRSCSSILFQAIRGLTGFGFSHLRNFLGRIPNISQDCFWVRP